MRSHFVVVLATFAGIAAGLASAVGAQTWEGPAAFGLRVTDEDGNPIGEAQVVARVSDAEAVGPAPILTDAGGRAVVSGLREGEWFIEVSHPGYMLYAAYINLRAGKKPVVGFSSQVNTDKSWAPMTVKFQKATAEFSRTGTTKRAEPKPPAVVREQPPRPRPEPPRVVRPEPSPPKVVRSQVAAEEPVSEEPESEEPKPDEPRTEAEATLAVDAPADTSETAQATQPEVAQPEIEPTVVDESERLSETAPVSAPAVEAPPTIVETIAEEAPTSVPDAEVAVPEPELQTPTQRIEDVPEPVPAPPGEPEPGAGVTDEPGLEDEVSAEVEPTPAVDEAESPELPAEAPSPIPPAEAVAGEAKPQPAPVPAVEAAPSEGAGPTAAARLPRYLRSAPAGTCSECEPGEWAVSAEQEAARAGDVSTQSECTEDYLTQVRDAAQILADESGSRLTDYSGPVLTAMWRLEPGVSRERLQEYLGAVTDPTSNCQMAGVVLPDGASFSGYVLEAWDRLGGRACRAKLDCAVGQARWISEPVVVAGEERTVVYSVFKNRSTRRERRLRMTIYFKHERDDWSPRAR